MHRSRAPDQGRTVDRLALGHAGQVDDAREHSIRRPSDAAFAGRGGITERHGEGAGHVDRSHHFNPRHLIGAAGTAEQLGGDRGRVDIEVGSSGSAGAVVQVDIDVGSSGSAGAVVQVEGDGDPSLS